MSRAIKTLRLPLVLALLTFAFTLPPSVANATLPGGSGCNTSCWNSLCPDAYFGCLDEGGTKAACCLHGNECASFCGPDCPRFCP